MVSQIELNGISALDATKCIYYYYYYLQRILKLMTRRLFDSITPSSLWRCAAGGSKTNSSGNIVNVVRNRFYSRREAVKWHGNDLKNRRVRTIDESIVKMQNRKKFVSDFCFLLACRSFRKRSSEEKKLTKKQQWSTIYYLMRNFNSYARSCPWLLHLCECRCTVRRRKEFSAYCVRSFDRHVVRTYAFFVVVVSCLFCCVYVVPVCLFLFHFVPCISFPFIFV